MDVGRALVQGVDLWLNNPRRPLEASGTSGQKVPFNGGLNASILDGWWDEAYQSGAGWAIGSRREAGRDSTRQDREDCAALHRVLGVVVPLFYDRRRDGIPHRWLRCVKKSMEAFIPVFNSDHMVQQYREKLYEPAAELGDRFHRQAALADGLVAWKARIRRCWPLVHLLKASWKRTASKHVLEVDIFSGGIELADLRARAWNRTKAAPIALDRCFDGVGREVDDGVLRYRFTLPRTWKAPIRVRLWPQHAALPHPHEVGLSFEVDV